MEKPPWGIKKLYGESTMNYAIVRELEFPSLNAISNSRMNEASFMKI
jgi:hypothetical protein